MKFNFLKDIKIAAAFVFMLSLGFLTFLSSCVDDDEGGQTVELLSYGPMPVPRGSELRFIGNNLDKVTSIVLPDNIEISDFDSKSASLITLTVPQNAVEGNVKIKYSGGEIVTKTPIGFLEPIVIESFSPAAIRPDSILTITGDYLNLINEVIFTDRISVKGQAIISKSRNELKVKVPATAQTGKIALSNGNEDPIIVYSKDNLTITLPSISSIGPNPVKAGSNLTITGANLDLVKTVVFGGNKSVTEFESQSASTLVVKVPTDAQDGKIVLLPESGVEVSSSNDLTMIVPTVSVSPTTVKNGTTVTVTGANLDLIDKVIFAGGFEGNIQDGGSPTEIIVEVPNEAISGIVKFTTLAQKEVQGPSLTLVSPGLTSFTPSSSKPNNDITITGTDLDLVVKVIFEGGIEGNIVSQSETSMDVTVPVGAKTGKITLVAQNGVEVQSSADLTVESNLPDFTSYSEARGTPGQILTINGASLLLIKEIIFPGDIKATAYGLKSDTQVEVYVPADVPIGTGAIRIVTFEGEEGLLPEIFFGSIDPVYDENLLFFNFNGPEKGSWWGNAINSGVEDDPSNSADGSPYWRVNGMSGTGWWDGLFFRNGGDHFSSEGVDANTWAVRFDLRTFSDFPATGNLSIRLGSYFYDFNLNEEMGFSNTNGWITVTAPLSEFLDNGTPLTDPSVGASEFGMVWRSGTSVEVNIGIDNVRFEPIP